MIRPCFKLIGCFPPSSFALPLFSWLSFLFPLSAARLWVIMGLFAAPLLFLLRQMEGGGKEGGRKKRKTKGEGGAGVRERRKESAWI